MSLTPGKQERFHFLDGLRAVAASMVVIHHSFTSNVVRFFDLHHLHFIGFLFTRFFSFGVNLFFVLSGVVLLRPYLRGFRKFKVPEYFYRRFTRIYPPYFAALIFGAFVIWFINVDPTWYNEKGIHMQFTWLETFKEMGIVSFNQSYYNLAWWSLGVEVVFYLCVPFIILSYPTRARLTDGRLVITIIGGLAVAVLLQVIFNKYLPSVYSNKQVMTNSVLVIEYVVCFLMGILIAAKDFSMKYARAFFIGGVLLACCESFYVPLIHSAYGLIFAAVIIFAFNARWFKVLLSKPFMIWLGERSYSLFLVHFSVFYLVDNTVARFTSERNGLYAILTRGIGLPLALFAAMLLFHFVEKKTARGLLTGNMFWPWQTGALKQLEKEL